MPNPIQAPATVAQSMAEAGWSVSEAAASMAKAVLSVPEGASGATEFAPEFIRAVWFCIAALTCVHALLGWRWWTLHSLLSIPPEIALVTHITTVKDESDGGRYTHMTYVLTPTTGPDAGKEIRRAASVRMFTRRPTAVGQHIAVHVHPTISRRHMVPEAGNPTSAWLVILVLNDLVLAVTFLPPTI